MNDRIDVSTSPVLSPREARVQLVTPGVSKPRMTPEESKERTVAVPPLLHCSLRSRTPIAQKKEDGRDSSSFVFSYDVVVVVGNGDRATCVLVVSALRYMYTVYRYGRCWRGGRPP